MQSDYQRRFEELVDQYFSTRKIPTISGTILSGSEIHDEVITPQLLMERLKNGFREHLARSYFDDEGHVPEFRIIAFDTLSDFRESTIDAFGLNHYPSEKEKLKKIYDDLCVGVVAEVFRETEKRLEAMQGEESRVEGRKKLH